MIFQIIKSPDARLENNNIYKINVVFRCYLNKNGKKPDFVRKIIAEKCLTRAQKLDEAFTNTLYRAFDLPENYLYNKLTNITRKQKPNVAPNVDLENKINPVAQEENIAINMPYKRGGRGGKVTKKYNHNKNSAKIKFINNVY
jgi:antitoxin component YwqK of YwqJK toxin-antitoxin module